MLYYVASYNDIKSYNLTIFNTMQGLRVGVSVLPHGLQGELPQIDTGEASRARVHLREADQGHGRGQQS